ncbi:glycosyltransferase family 9 protein, partial [candidate division KSB1 bacterium]|nr:glycosyltransferase family 9 protein [candidate division KSB1 bacterium]
MKKIILSENPINKILIIQTAFPGDIILTTPLIQATRLQFPTSKIDFLTIPICQNLIETHPALNQVIVFDKRGQHKGWRRLWHLAKHLQNQNYDLALIPHRSLRSAVLAFWAKIPIRIGFHTSAAAFLFTHKVRYHPEKHEIDRNLQLLENFIKEIPVLKPEIFVTPEDKKVVDKFWGVHQIPDQ